jgi:hypothetical protein
MPKTLVTRMSDFLRAYEKVRDAQLFIEKSPKDNIICVICGGCYTRRDKSKHARRKKHLRMLPLVLEGTVFPYIEWISPNEIDDENAYN